jgi:toxin ParE1/3/4
MARIAWSIEALWDLDHIRTYIAEFDPKAAARIHAGLLKAGNGLCDFPNRGRPANRGRRELPTVPPYVIRYSVRGDVVVIEAIRHGAQRRD